METRHTHEIRRAGETLAQSSIPGLGYDRGLLRRMMADGYGYYINGKRVKRLEDGK